MKTILSTILSAAFVCAAFAQVPSLINYQGRLTAANGSPVTGSKTFAISIYDAATGGNLLYTETIGAVTLDSNGVYSFQFGGAGTSNTQVSETIATTDGTSTTFQKVLANGPVVAGTVSVTDGTYTWTQSAGSSNEDDFGVAYSNSLRRVTANYYAGAPASGKTITATYRYGASGISGALSSGAEHWMAVSVDSVVQGTRQRVLAVPFAILAKNVAPEVITGITSSTRAELDSVYSMLAGFVLAKEVTSSRQSYSGNSQIEIFDNSDGKYDCVVSTNGKKTASGIYANRIIELGTFAHRTSPETVTYPINNKIRYVEFNSSLVASVQTSVLFSYADGSTSLIEKPGFSPNTGITFRYGNPNPSKIVSSITRYASDLRGAITDSYASLSSTEIVIKCSTVMQAATSLSVAAQSSRQNAKNVFSWKVFNSSNFQVAESGGPTISIPNGANIDTIMLTITPEITGSETDCDLIEGVSFVKIR